jgi:hypothetical protein
MLAGGTHVTPLEHHELVALRIEKFLGDRGLIEVRRSEWPKSTRP